MKYPLLSTAQFISSLMLASSLTLVSSHAFAMAECAGVADDGSFVTLQMTTVGATAKPDEGAVVIERGENKFGYHFKPNEISQYFEFDDQANNSAVVGIAAYVDNNDPVSVKYVGPNFVDMELKVVIASGKTNAVKGNFLRVWKGPGHAATDQYQLTNIACSVWSNN